MKNVLEWEQATGIFFVVQTNLQLSVVTIPLEPVGSQSFNYNVFTVPVLLFYVPHLQLM